MEKYGGDRSESSTKSGNPRSQLKVKNKREKGLEEEREGKEKIKKIKGIGLLYWPNTTPFRRLKIEQGLRVFNQVGRLNRNRPGSDPFEGLVRVTCATRSEPTR